MEDIREAKSIINRVGYALFILAVAVVGSQLMIDFLVSRFYPAAIKTDWYLWVLTAVTMIAIGLPIFGLLMSRIPDSPRGEIVKLKPSTFIVLFFCCVAAMYITNLVSGIITTAIAYLKGDRSLLNPIENAVLNGNFVLTIIYTAVIAPIIEELIFRKLLLNKLRRFGDMPAILMTGIAFGLFHMNLSQFFYAAVLGFIFAYIAIRTNTIRYTIILHMMINLIGTLVTMLAVSKNEVSSLLISLWVFASTLTGVILFAVHVKDIKLNRAELFPLKKSALVINPGMILYILACMVGIVTITLA